MKALRVARAAAIHTMGHARSAAIQALRVARAAAVVAARIVAGYLALCCLLLFLYGFIDPPVTGIQLQRRVEAILEGSSPRLDIRRARVAPILGRAVVAAEDGRFFEHHGIDLDAIRQAAKDNERRRRMRGGSTITQQLVKNLFMTTHSSYLRKAFEIPLALAADLLLTKERLLALYLTVVEWGPGVFGAEAAARYHLGKPAQDLTRADAATLAALLPAPRTRTPAGSAWYRTIILRRMDQMGFRP